MFLYYPVNNEEIYRASKPLKTYDLLHIEEKYIF